MRAYIASFVIYRDHQPACSIRSSSSNIQPDSYLQISLPVPARLRQTSDSPTSSSCSSELPNDDDVQMPESFSYDPPNRNPTPISIPSSSYMAVSRPNSRSGPSTPVLGDPPVQGEFTVHCVAINDSKDLRRSTSGTLEISGKTNHRQGI
jgi:hypothetical protein